MNTSFLTLFIFSSIAVTSCVFLASYFIFIKKDDKLKDYILGLLFIAIALRITKSIFYFGFEEISAGGVSLGFLGFTCIGPLALTYYSIYQSNFSQLKPVQLLHLIFPIVGAIIIMFNRDLTYNLYFLANISLVVYLGFVASQFIFNSKATKLSKWHKALYYALVILSLIFFFQLLGGTTVNRYAIGIALSSFVMYFLFFYVLQSPTVIKKTHKALPKSLLQKITSALEDDNIYLQPAITLAQFSEAIDTPTYLVSKATKHLYNKSFPEVINSFRIKAITKKLSQPNYANEKIEDLAHDVGFNTTSTFYHAFKKETSMSPRAFQRMLQEKAIG